MASFNRSVILTGPAKCVTTYPSGTSVTFFHKSNLEVKRVVETFRVGSQGQGDEERIGDYMHQVSIVPEGRWNANLIAALWPHLNKLPGAPLFGDTDRTLVLTGTDGVTQTMISAAVTKMPNLKFSAEESLIGAVEFTGLLGNNMDWDDASNRETAGTGGTFTDSGYSNALIPTQEYLGALGAVTGFSSIDTLDGFDVQFNLRLNRFQTNRLGTYQYFFAGLDVAVNFIPVNISDANIKAATAGLAQLRGAALRANSNGTGAFTIVGADGITYLTIPSASVKSSGVRWGLGDNFARPGEIAIVGNWTFSSGAQVALATFAAS